MILLFLTFSQIWFAVCPYKGDNWQAGSIYGLGNILGILMLATALGLIVWFMNDLVSPKSNK